MTEQTMNEIKELQMQWKTYKRVCDFLYSKQRLEDSTSGEYERYETVLETIYEAQDQINRDIAKLKRK